MELRNVVDCYGPHLLLYRIREGLLPDPPRQAIYDKFGAEPSVKFAYPHVPYVPAAGDKDEEREAAWQKERLPVVR